MSWTPISPDAVLARLVAWLDDHEGMTRAAIDGPPCAEPAALADALLEPLRAAGRPAVHIAARTFWHDASLRLEHGREDPDSYLTWLDAAALQREVLDRLVTSGQYLPALRDPETNRSTRDPVRAAEPGTVLIVSGDLLLGRGLPFERTVHLLLSPAALARRTAAADAWTLPAFAQYAATARPAQTADLVLRVDDPRHPAMAT